MSGNQSAASSRNGSPHRQEVVTQGQVLVRKVAGVTSEEDLTAEELNEIIKMKLDNKGMEFTAIMAFPVLPSIDIAEGDRTILDYCTYETYKAGPAWLTSFKAKRPLVLPGNCRLRLGGSPSGLDASHNIYWKHYVGETEPHVILVETITNSLDYSTVWAIMTSEVPHESVWRYSELQIVGQDVASLLANVGHRRRRRQ